MVPTFARPVTADTTKMVTPALDVNLLAVPEQEKQLRVLQRLIVFVHKMCVHVPTVMLPPELLVLPIMPKFARPVPADTTKKLIPVIFWPIIQTILRAAPIFLVKLTFLI